MAFCIDPWDRHLALCIMTLGIMAFCIMTLGIMAFFIMTPGIMSCIPMFYPTYANLTNLT